MSLSSRDSLNYLLWDDSEFCHDRIRKSVKILAAVASTLRKRATSSGGELEFLNLFDAAARSDPNVLSSVLSDPSVYWWVRGSCRRVQACLHATNTERESSEQKLFEHLEQFKRFVLSICVQTRRDLMFERPYRVSLPVHLPGTDFSLSGEGGVALLGIASGRLMATTRLGRTISIPFARHEHFDDAEITRHHCPIVEYQGCRLRLQPHAFHLPGLREAEELARVDADSQHDYQRVVSDTLAVLEKHDPQSFAQLSDTVKVLALRPCGSELTNTSYAMLPGSFATTASSNPLSLAEDFVHELYHNRLFALEERGSFFESADGRSNAAFYSPWRSDPRPLYGVFHAMYVFTRVCRFWLRVYEAPDLTAAHRQYAASRARCVMQQLQMAEFVLRKQATLSQWGRSLFEEVAAEGDRLAAKAARLSLPNDLPALESDPDGSYKPLRSQIDDQCLTVQQGLAEHQRLYDTTGQCARFFESAEAA